MLFLSQFVTFLLAYIFIFPIYFLVTVANSCVRLLIWTYFKFTTYTFAPSLDNVFQILSVNSTIITILLTEQSSTEVDLAKENAFVQSSILDKLDGNGDKINKKLKYIWCKKVQ